MIKDTDLDPAAVEAFLRTLDDMAREQRQFSYSFAVAPSTPIGISEPFYLRAEHHTCPCCGQPYCQRWYP